MSAGVALVTPQDCCGPCPDVVVTMVPGSAGAPGAAGAAGTNGKNAFTVTTASFIVPAEGATVVISVADSASFVPTSGGIPGENIRIEFAGTYLVTAKGVGTLTVKNLANTASALYTDNAVPTTVIPSGATVSPSGLQGPPGTIPGGAFAIANNLSEGVPATMRASLALGTAAVKAVGVANTNLPPVDTTFTNGNPVVATATGVQTQTPAAFRTTIGLGTAATLPSGSFLQAANNLSDIPNPATARANLGITSSLDYVLIQDQSGAASGTFTSGAWRTRNLSAEVSDVGNHAVLAANQVTLKAGTYRFRGIAPAHKVDGHQVRLQNITAGTTIAFGTSAYCSSAAGLGTENNTYSEVVGRVTFAVDSVVELQHQCVTTQATDGFGLFAGFGGNVYSSLEFWKE